MYGKILVVLRKVAMVMARITITTSFSGANCEVMNAQFSATLSL